MSAVAVGAVAACAGPTATAPAGARALPEEAYAAALAALDTMTPRRLLLLVRSGLALEAVWEGVVSGRSEGLPALDRLWESTDQLRARWPKLAALMDESEHDVLAYMAFPAQHRTKLHSTNPLERLNKEVKRRADVVGIFPNEASIVRLIGAVLLEQNDEWQLQHRYMQVEAMAELAGPALDTDTLELPPKAA